MFDKPNSKNETPKTGAWNNLEHQSFRKGLESVGKDWKKLKLFVPTRSQTQIRSHAQKYFDKLTIKFESVDRLGKQQYEKIKGPIVGESLREYQIYLNLVKAKVSLQSDSVSQQQSQPMISNAPVNLQCSELLSETYPGTIDQSRPIFSRSPKVQPQLQSYFSKMLKDHGVTLAHLNKVSFFDLFLDKPLPRHSLPTLLFNHESRQSYVQASEILKGLDAPVRLQ